MEDVETIFRETLDGKEYLYWYSVQGEDGQDVEEQNIGLTKGTYKIGKNV